MTINLQYPNILYGIEAWGHEYFGICICIIVSPSASLPRKFQDLAFRFPGHSTSPKFYKKNSKTFQEALEPWSLFTQSLSIYCSTLLHLYSPSQECKTTHFFQFFFIFYFSHFQFQKLDYRFWNCTRRWCPTTSLCDATFSHFSTTPIVTGGWVTQTEWKDTRRLHILYICPTNYLKVINSNIIYIIWLLAQNN